MSNPFRDDIKEPRWMTYGPDHSPLPENYLPTEARKALLQLAEEWLDPVDINLLMDKVLSEDPDTMHADALREVYEDWLKLTKQFANIAMNVYDETVGDA